MEHSKGHYLARWCRVPDSPLNTLRGKAKRGKIKHLPKRLHRIHLSNTTRETAREGGFAFLLRSRRDRTPRTMCGAGSSVREQSLQRFCALLVPCDGSVVLGVKHAEAKAEPSSETLSLGLPFFLTGPILALQRYLLLAVVRGIPIFYLRKLASIVN